jgi:predicted 2-oxoglutarate/Fe(II)-dependent dioxygenase YbiX
MENKKENIIFDSGINAAINLLQQHKIKFTKLQVRNAFSRRFKKDIINLLDISVVLQRNGINNEAFKIHDFNQLQNIRTPFITLIQDGEHGLEHITVTSISKTNIKYINADALTQTQKITHFKKQWNSVVFLLNTKAKYFNKTNYSQSVLTEKKQKNAYLKQSFKSLPNFLTPTQCKQIIKYCTQNNLFKQSPLTNSTAKNVSYYSAQRTSQSALINYTNNELFNGIYEKTKQLLHVQLQQIEVLQCVRYKKNNHFVPHYDSNKLLNRKHTILVYLNENFSGGETCFPELDKKIKPKTGHAILFRNTTQKNTNQLYAVHAGLPVTKGIKYALNIWVQG